METCFSYLSVFQAQLIDPALKGTMNVLRSCAKVPSFKRVIVTSSMTSVAFNGKPLAPDVLVDESWFSDPVFCEKSRCLYEMISHHILSLFYVLVCGFTKCFLFMVLTSFTLQK